MFVRVSRTRNSLLTISLLGVLVVLAAALVFSQRAAVGAPPTPTLSIVVPARVRVGEQLRAKVVATGMRNLGGFQSTVSFHPDHLLVADATVTEGLKGPNRDLLALGPVLRNGSVVIGAVTCPVSQCASVRYKESARNPLGIDGRVELAEIVFEAKAPGRLELKLDQTQLVDPQGNVLPALTTNATVDIVGQ